MYRSPRGTTDILPQEQPFWRFVKQAASDHCQLYGYQRIETPVFEEAGLFVRTVGESTDIVEKEMYSFKDRDEQLMTLRPEGTAPVCRAYLEHGMQNLTQPVRLYYFASIFRYERPQAGRYREHHQFGAEAIGDADPALDAEIIELAWSLYASLGLKDITILLNSIGCPKCRPAYLEELKRYYSGRMADLCPECQRRMDRNALRLLDCKNQACSIHVAEAPKSHAHLCPECAVHFESLRRYLGVMGIPFQLEHRLVRGLDYYTKTVFEVQPLGGGAQSTIGGGGRYDNLIEQLGGKPTPAVGFATGLERIILNLKKQNIEASPLPGPGVFVASLGEAARDRSLKLVSDLRKAGVGAVLSSGGRSLKAQLRQANALGTTRAVIIGEDELKKGVAMLRDMQTSQQREVSLESLVAEVGGEGPENGSRG